MSELTTPVFATEKEAIACAVVDTLINRLYLFGDLLSGITDATEPNSQQRIACFRLLMEVVATHNLLIQDREALFGSRQEAMVSEPVPPIPVAIDVTASPTLH